MVGRLLLAAGAITLVAYPVGFVFGATAAYWVGGVLCVAAVVLWLGPAQVRESDGWVEEQMASWRQKHGEG